LLIKDDESRPHEKKLHFETTPVSLTASRRKIFSRADGGMAILW
jgi:hypothetical protein